MRAWQGMMRKREYNRCWVATHNRTIADNYSKKWCRWYEKSVAFPFFLLLTTLLLQNERTIFYEDGQGHVVDEHDKPEPMDSIVDQELELYALETFSSHTRVPSK